MTTPRSMSGSNNRGRCHVTRLFVLFVALVLFGIFNLTFLANFLLLPSMLESGTSSVYFDDSHPQSSSSSSASVRNQGNDDAAPPTEVQVHKNMNEKKKVTEPLTPSTPISQPPPQNHHSDESSSLSSSSQRKYQPTFIWGILSVLDDKKQRQVLRETYLRYYKDLGDEDRICSLNDIILHKKRSSSSSSSSSSSLYANCQIAYVFVVGGNPQGPTELVHPNASFPMTITDSVKYDDIEDDVVILNIQENMEDGKSQTWFKYASTIVQEEEEEHGYNFDYVLKIDSDTLVLIPSFMEFVDTTLPKQRPVQRVYAGVQHYADSCDPNAVDHPHPCPLHLLGGTYMGGAIYWMSSDLAAFVASDAVNRDQLKIRHEDADMGNFVFSHPEKDSIQTVGVDRTHILISRLYDCKWQGRDKGNYFKDIYWGHSESGYFPGPFFKDERNYRKLWRQFQGWWASGRKASKKTEIDLFKLYDLPPTANGGDSLVRINDYIYSDQDFDSSPIVLESHKLVFFTVSGVADADWRRLFRRMEGIEDWKKDEEGGPITRPPRDDGLKRLSDFTVEKASEIMTSPDYTRALFVRDPKVRLISNYMNYVQKDNGEYIRWPCCGGDQDCANRMANDFPYFLDVIQECDEPYWRPQGRRMEPRYYELLNFIGNYATLQEDSERLLKQLGAWDVYGSTGWGEDGTRRIFDDASAVSRAQFKSFYPDPEIEKKAQKAFKRDYENTLLKLTRKAQMDPGAG